MGKDQDSPSFGDKVTRNLGWRFSGTAVGLVLQFGFGVVLARLLPPSDFGLVALVFIVIGFGNVFATLGMGPAIIQRADLKEIHVRVGFSVSLILGLTLTGGVFLTAPLLASALGDLGALGPLRWMSLLFLLSGFGVVSQALLSRDLAFRQLFWVGVGSQAGYGTIGVSLALAGYGVWSLVWATLFQRLIQSLGFYLFSLHSILPSLNLRALRDLLRFGTGISLEGFANYFALQGDYLVIGRVLGARPLGLYTRAYKLMMLPTTHFVEALGSVLFPAVSQIQYEEEKFRRVYLQVISVMSVVALPALVVLLIVSPELVIGVYGEQWRDAIAPLQVLAIFGLFRSLYNGQSNFIKARGRVYALTMCQVIYGGSVLFGSWLGAKLFGLEGVAVAVGLSILLMWLMVSLLANSVTKTDLRNFLQSFKPALILAAFTGAACIGAKLALNGLDAHPLLVLFGSVAIGGLALLSAAMFVPSRFLLSLPQLIVERLSSAAPPALRERLSWPRAFFSSQWGKP